MHSPSVVPSILSRNLSSHLGSCGSEICTVEPLTYLFMDTLDIAGIKQFLEYADSNEKPVGMFYPNNIMLATRDTPYLRSNAKERKQTVL